MDSDTKWINSIKESTNANIVKLFFTRDASLVFQQSLLALIYMLEARSNWQDKTHISYFVDEDVFNLNKFDFDVFKNNSAYNDKFSIYKNNVEIPGGGGS